MTENKNQSKTPADKYREDLADEMFFCYYLKDSYDNMTNEESIVLLEEEFDRIINESK